jgi:arginine decarboxylase
MFVHSGAARVTEQSELANICRRAKHISSYRFGEEPAMSRLVVARATIADIDDLYKVNAWGDGHFRVSGQGTIDVMPEGPSGPSADLDAIVTTLRKSGVQPPIVVRFPQILHHRVERINKAFLAALKDNDLKDVRYRGVFPVKVNQRKEVVQELTRSGRRWQYGLEVGSKAELIAALTMDPNRKSLLVVNGFKDRAFLDAACHATAFKDEVVIVLDEVGELPHILEMLDGLDNPPLLGLRLKLRSKAPGKWALSGGEKAKFGLTIPEVLWAVEELRKVGRLDLLRMLHFHIGSQISNIRRIAEGVREASRIHTELIRLGVPLDRIDVGGGLAVDYDGSASSGSNSCNYTVEEYANTVVATIKDVCEEAEIPVPDIISESGRAVAAHHACLVTNVVRRVPYLDAEELAGDQEPGDPSPLANLYAVQSDLSAKNVFELFHDVVQFRDDLYALFELGHLGLPALGRAESLLRTIFRRVKVILESEDELETEEYVMVRDILAQKLILNFSLFQSIPDVWGVRQQFPILPIHRLKEMPTESATLADITCDSDGEIRRFIDTVGSRDSLPVHALRRGEPYHLAAFLVGAYQDSLGDYHNLFGETDEAIVTVNDDGWEVTRVIPGSRVAEMLDWVRYDSKDLKRRIKRRVQRLRDNGRINATGAKELTERFVTLIESPTYLDSSE